MAAPAHVDPPPILPRRFPIWAGLLVAAAAAGLFFLMGRFGILPHPIWTVAGQWLVGGHALAAFALTSMLIDWAKLSRWSAALRRQESGPVEAIRSGPVGDGIDWVMIDLRRRYAVSELGAAVDRRSALLLREASFRWWIGTAAAFLVPLFGGLASLWNLKLDSNIVPFREVGLPLIVSVIEAMPLFLLSRALRQSTETALARWAVAVKEVAGIQRPDGSRAEPDETLFAIAPPATPPHPPLTPVSSPSTTSPAPPEAAPRPPDRPAPPPPPVPAQAQPQPAVGDKDELYY